MKGDFLVQMEKLHAVYGSCIELHVFNKRIFVFSDLDLMREVMSKRPKLFSRPSVLAETFDILNLHPHGIFTAEGAGWGRLRRLTAAPFNKQNVSNMRYSIIKEVDTFIRKWCEMCELGTAQVNIADELMQLTLAIILRVAIGDVSALNKYGNANEMYRDTKTVFEFIGRKSLFQLPNFVWKMMHGDIEETAKKINAKFNYVINGIVEKERAAFAAQLANSSGAAGSGLSAPTRPLSYIQILVREATPGVDGISNRELVENVKTIMLAGSETTSVTLSYCLYYLSMDADLLAEVRAEVDQYFSKENVALVDGEEAWSKVLLGDAADVDSLTKRFPLVSACFRETLRLSGPAPFTGHGVAVQDSVTLSDGTVLGPTDTLFAFNEGRSRDPEIYPNPLRFDPHRWLRADPDSRKAMEDNMMPFGYGPRICPGMTLARLEGELILAALVSCFEFSLACAPSELQRRLFFTAQLEALPMKISIRTKTMK
jgi:cytochrome P450